MNKLLDVFKNLKDKWTGLSKRKKIVSVILGLAIVISLISFILLRTKTKYAVLFSKLDSTDASTVIKKLDEDKIPHKENSSDNTIYVPEQNVDKLRLQYASTLKNGSTGFELFDNGNSKFGTTDSEFKVEYQRAIQGELERTIKGFDAVDDARVQLVMSEDSAFVKDSTAASASVTLKMKYGQTLTKEQVKAIISLVSGSVKNLSKGNIQVVDDKMNLLSKGLFDSKGNDFGSDSGSAESRNKMQTTVENQLEKKALDALEEIYGKGRVKVKVNADLNFDSNETNTETYYNNKGNPNDTKNPVIVSEHNQENTNSGGASNNSGSTVDNNTNSNTISNGNNGSTSTSKDTTTNYDVSSEKSKVVKSPGDIRRLTVSVLVDGKVSGTTQSTLTNIVSNAVGVNQQRGDSVSVEGMPFDTTAQDNAKKALKDMQKEQDAANKKKLYIGIGIGAAILLIIIALVVFSLIKRKRNEDDEDEFEDEELDNTQNIDAVIGDEIENKKPKVKFAPIDFEGEDNEEVHVEKEIKKYASTKPDQVADIVKAWLKNDEG